jgi:hypothetical protein
MQAKPVTLLDGVVVTRELQVTMAPVTASTELFAIAATIAGGQVPPAVISEANILANRVHHALEVFRGARENVRDLELEICEGTP